MEQRRVVSQSEPFADEPTPPKPYSADALQALLKSRSDGGAGR
jgi:hypothetical protein